MLRAVLCQFIVVLAEQGVVTLQRVIPAKTGLGIARYNL
uniref:Uncharacterized protein n=1 Tax=Anguilla anguilla TaxID=7936 RepID=A0A0E9XTS1_ANGAN